MRNASLREIKMGIKFDVMWRKELKKKKKFFFFDTKLKKKIHLSVRLDLCS
jgi:hypothetical protein